MGKFTRHELTEKATQVGLDIPRFEHDMDAHRFRSVINTDSQTGSQVQLGTTRFLVNGRTSFIGRTLRSTSDEPEDLLRLMFECELSAYAEPIQRSDSSSHTSYHCRNPSRRPAPSTAG